MTNLFWPSIILPALAVKSCQALGTLQVGVGDGPWDIMEEFDDHIIGR
jgi:hypothetical protein